MAEITLIPWADATFNAWIGCNKVGPGCENCYAERDSKRFHGDKVLWGVNAQRITMSENYWKQPIKWDKKAAEKGVRQRVFCSSMADIFDKNAPEGIRDRLWALIKATPNIDWLILTKRIGNAKSMLPPDWGDGYKNVWLIITVVNQEEATRDIIKLIDTPAAVRGLSMEPLLGEVSLRWLPAFPENAPTTAQSPSGTTNEYDGLRKLDWIIAGGESGCNARPMNLDWARSLRDQCKAANVPFFFKQLSQSSSKSFKDYTSFPEDLKVREFPKNGEK